jgi:hypothetical protein
MDTFVKSIIEVARSKEMKSAFQKLVIDQLAGKTAEEAERLLMTLETVGPVLSNVITSTAKSLRRMPFADLVRLLGEFVGKGFVPKAAANTPSKAEPKTRKPMVMSAARKAGLKLQGQYMGRLRGALPPVQAQAKKIKAASGYKAALAFLVKAKSGKLPVKAPAKPKAKLVKKVVLKKNPPKKVPLKVKKG